MVMHNDATMPNDDTEYEVGQRDAIAEMTRDGWTRETARRYLANVSPSSRAYSRGYGDAVRTYAEGGRVSEKKRRERWSPTRAATASEARISVACTEAEKEAWQRAAYARQTTLSAIAREAWAKAAKAERIKVAE